MAREMAVVLRYIRHLIETKDRDEQSDSQLLQQFVRGRDENAFAALLQRHGPLVFGVCQQVLRDRHDAEDAFQATFLVLARKAASIRKQESLTAWLYRVAVNISRTAKTGAAHRRTHERRAVLMSKTSLADEVALRDLQPLVHEEVNRLPEKYRVPVVLCYFEGMTHDEAARQLGWPLGTVKGRLARARHLLRARLTRRGLVLSAGVLAGALTPSACMAHPPFALFGVTLKAAIAFGAGAAIPAGTTSTQAVALAKVALSNMTSIKVGTRMVIMMIVALVATYSLAAGMSADRQGDRSLVPDRLAHKPEADGDPLPPGAVARMGTPRFRHGGPVLSMAYLADGKILATGGYIGTRRETRMGRIRLWDTTTGKELRQFQLKGTANVAGSPDGKILAGADESDGVIYLWEAATGKEIRRLKSSQSGFEGILPVAFSSDGKKLVAGGHEPRIWEVETGKLLHSVKDQQESVIDLASSADGNILAVNYCDLVAPKLFQVVPWKVLASLRPERPGGLLDGPRLEHFVFSSDKKTLAVTTEASGWIYLLDVTDGMEVRRIHAHQIGKDIQYPFGEHRDHECITALVFSPDGKTLASAASDKAIRLWEVATGKERHSFPADTYTIGSLAFAPDGKSLAWANSAGLIRIYDLRTGKASNSHDGHLGVVTSVALSPDSKTLITGSTDASIRLWETTSGKELRRFEGHQGSIASIHLSRDGKTLASVSPADKTVRVWEVTTGKELRRFRASTTYCEATWLPDSRRLIIRRCDDPAVYFYDVATGKETRKIEKTWLGVRGMFYPTNVEAVHEGNILAVSPNGKMLVTSVNCSGGSFHLWDTATGKELPSLWPDANNQLIVGTAVFSSDSKALVIGSSYPTTIQMWDIATRKERQQFGSHLILKDSAGEEYEVPTYMKITSMAISPNGRTLATAGWDPTIRLWDVATGKEHPRLEGHRGTVTSLAWSADGKTLVSGSNDGTALVWDVSSHLK
jgi:RNA polymerase sigma factor (sigma-70 family)